MLRISGFFSQRGGVASALGLIVVLVCLFGCNDEDPTVVNHGSSDSPAGLTLYTDVGECKVGDFILRDYPSLDQDCLVWEWDGEGGLIIRHLNTALNCCPQVPAILTVVFAAPGEPGVITLAEDQVVGDCDCYCLFDLEFSLSEVPPGSYELTVLPEDVGQGELHPTQYLELLAGQPDAGSVCIERHSPPWPTE